MKIKPDWPNIQNRSSPASASPKTGAFVDTLAADIRQSAGTTDLKPLASVASAFNKTELGDPAKADSIIGHAVHEIMNREFGNMCAPDREQVAAWLRSDPMVREALLRHITLLAS